jgi:hypothetical protein
LATVKGQPTELIGGDIPPTAGKQSKGAIMQPPPAMPAGMFLIQVIFFLFSL